MFAPAETRDSVWPTNTGEQWSTLVEGSLLPRWALARSQDSAGSEGEDASKGLLAARMWL